MESDSSASTCSDQENETDIDNMSENFGVLVTPTSHFYVTPGITTIGRGKCCEVVLPHKTVSKVHAYFELKDGCHFLSDSHSKNSTSVDGVKITPGHNVKLEGGSSIKFSNVSCHYFIPKSTSQFDVADQKGPEKQSSKLHSYHENDSDLYDQPTQPFRLLSDMNESSDDDSTPPIDRLEGACLVNTANGKKCKAYDSNYSPESRHCEANNFSSRTTETSGTSSDIRDFPSLAVLDKVDCNMAEAGEISTVLLPEKVDNNSYGNTRATPSLIDSDNNDICDFITQPMPVSIESKYPDTSDIPAQEMLIRSESQFHDVSDLPTQPILAGTETEFHDISDLPTQPMLIGSNSNINDDVGLMKPMSANIQSKYPGPFDITAQPTLYGLENEFHDICDLPTQPIPVQRNSNLNDTRDFSMNSSDLNSLDTPGRTTRAIKLDSGKLNSPAQSIQLGADSSSTVSDPHTQAMSSTAHSSVEDLTQLPNGTSDPTPIGDATAQSLGIDAETTSMKASEKLCDNSNLSNLVSGSATFGNAVLQLSDKNGVCHDTSSDLFEADTEIIEPIIVPDSSKKPMQRYGEDSMTNPNSSACGDGKISESEDSSDSFTLLNDVSSMCTSDYRICSSESDQKANSQLEACKNIKTNSTTLTSIGSKSSHTKKISESSGDSAEVLETVNNENTVRPNVDCLNSSRNTSRRVIITRRATRQSEKINVEGKGHCSKRNKSSNDNWNFEAKKSLSKMKNIITNAGAVAKLKSDVEINSEKHRTKKNLQRSTKPTVDGGIETTMAEGSSNSSKKLVRKSRVPSRKPSIEKSITVGARKRKATCCETSTIKNDTHESVEEGRNLRKRTKSSDSLRILFTGISCTHSLESSIKQMGGTLVQSCDVADVLVTDQIRRTAKFLCMVARGCPVVSLDWLHNNKVGTVFKDPWLHLLKDLDGEKSFGFCLEKSLSTSKQSKIFTGLKFFVTPNVTPPADIMRDILLSGGGTLVHSPRGMQVKRSYIISCEQDKHLWGKLDKNIPVVSSEFVLDSVLQQRMTPSLYRMQ